LSERLGRQGRREPEVALHPVQDVRSDRSGVEHFEDRVGRVGLAEDGNRLEVRPWDVASLLEDPAEAGIVERSSPLLRARVVGSRTHLERQPEPTDDLVAGQVGQLNIVHERQLRDTPLLQFLPAV